MTTKLNTYNNLYVEECEIENSEKNMKKAIKKLNEIENLKKKQVLTKEESEKLSMEEHYRKIAFPEIFEKKPSAKEEEFLNKKRQKRERENALKEAEILKKEKEKRERKEEEERLLREKENAKKEAERYKKEAERERKEAEKERQEIQKQRRDAERERIRLEKQKEESYAEANEELEKEINAEMKRIKRAKDKARRLANKEAKKIAERLEAERAEAERVRKEKEKEREKEKMRLKIMQSIAKSELEKEWAITLLDNNNNVNKTFKVLSLKYHPDKNPQKKIWAGEQQKNLNSMREAALEMRNIF
jgi:hypothetical protein